MHHVTMCKSSQDVNIVATCMVTLICFTHQFYKHLYLGLGSGDLKFQGLCPLMLCIESQHQNLHRPRKDSAFQEKTRSITLVLLIDAPQ